ncbi:hypothetical protein CRG98_042587 [Punica granatum]|uniref:DUF7745 domain-containing protein n=1 Tax=Punica granatum TaxID=22663 RepID=A0A2I0HZ86_PUNGR|nr:hypothetical protein CRG98_042587 [Punica granatum]
MDRPAPGLRLEAITPPRQDIMRIWRTLRPVDHAYIQGIIGDVVMLTETSVDWIFLRTAAELWDHEHAVFNFQGTELAPTIEEYTALIQRPTSTIHGIFVPNPFTTVQGQLSTLLHIPAQDIHEELHEREVRGGRMRGSPHLLQIWLLAHIRLFCSSHPFSYIANERSLIERLVPVIPPPEHSFSEWRRFWRELTLARFLWVARWNPGGPMITGYPGIVGVPLLSHLGSTLIFPGQSSIQAAMHAELRAIREERDMLRCELVDSSAEVADYREVQTQLTRARARVAHLDREMARLGAELDRVHKRARNLAHP